MGIADPESRAYRHIRGLDTHLGSTKMGVTIMLFYLPLLIVATTMGKLSQGYEYNPAVMEQRALGNTILDVVAHVPEEEEEEGKGNEYDEDRELPPSTPKETRGSSWRDGCSAPAPPQSCPHCLQPRPC